MTGEEGGKWKGKPHGTVSTHWNMFIQCENPALH